MVNSLTKEIIKLSTKLNPISVGTKFFSDKFCLKLNMWSYLITQTDSFELEKAEITSESILENLKRDVGVENLPEEYNFL